MTLNAEVQAYYQRWAPIGEYTKIRYDLISTIAYAWIGLHYDSGTHTVTLRKYDNYNIEVDKLVEYAHSRGVKVVLTFMCDTDADKSFISDSAARLSAVNALLAEVQTHGFDGIDNDIENSVAMVDMSSFQTLIADIFWKSNPNFRISLTIGFSFSKVDKIYDFSVLNDKVNYIFLMGYDYTWQTSPRAGPVGPILDDILYPGYGVSVSLDHYLGEGVPPNKLILGVPYYGYIWQTIDSSRTSSTIGSGIYASCKDMINNAAIYGRIWDTVWQTPWYTYQSDGRWYQGHYDDVQSLGVKYDLAISKYLAGIGMWAIDFETDYADFWNLIENKFSYSTCPSLVLCNALCPQNFVTIGETFELSVSWNGGKSPYTLQIYKDGSIYGNPISGITTINTNVNISTISWTVGNHNVYVQIIDSCSLSQSCNTNVCNVNIISNQNLILNSGFETGNIGSPDNWKKYSSGRVPSNPYKYPEIGKGGIGFSISIDFGSKKYQGKASWIQDVAIVPDTNYILSGYMKLKNVTGTGARIGIDWKNINGYVSSGIICIKIGTIDWVQCIGTVKSPSNANFGTIWLQLINGSGKVYFDDIFFGL